MATKTVESDPAFDRAVEAEIDRKIEEQKELERHLYHFDYRSWCRWCRLTRLGGA